MSRIDDFYKIDLYHLEDFKAAPNGDFQTVKGINNLKQALFHRLITEKGSIVHRPNYGVGIKRYQGAIYSLSNQKSAASDIKQQFELEERIDELVSVKFEKFEDIEGAFILTYKVRTSAGQLIEESVNPFGDIGI